MTKEEYYLNPNYCKNCGKIIPFEKRYNKFCNLSCSATYNNHCRIISNDQKIKTSLTLIAKNLLRRNGNLTYEQKQKLKSKYCSVCGTLKVNGKCPNYDICKHGKKLFINLSEFGLKLDKYQSIEILDEYNSIKELLYKEYIENELSVNIIKEKYNFSGSTEKLVHILKSIGISLRSLSEAIRTGLLNNRILLANSLTGLKFNSGWHTSWNNKRVYYRSGYELDFCKYLDSKQIYYQMESLRIKYFDSLNQTFRVAIPDFIFDNKIIEVKSRITFNKQNMIDKFNEYIKLGYIPSLLLEGKLYNYSEMLNLSLYKYVIC